MSGTSDCSPARDPGRALEVFVDALARRIVELAELAPAAGSEGAGAAAWLSVDQAAGYLGWPRQRLYRLTAAGAIPHYKHGRRLLFRAGELDAWLAGHRQAPVGD